MSFNLQIHPYINFISEEIGRSSGAPTEMC